MQNNIFACCGKDVDLKLLRRAVIDASGNYLRYCTSCASGNTLSVPDVYIGNGSGVQYEENIADKMGNPIPFYDKASKIAAMKQAGVHEAGDRIHGMRNETKRTKYFC